MGTRRLAILFVLAAATIAQAGLSPADLLLVVNRNVPESTDLANHYAEVRHVPAGRMLTLDLPRGEDISPADYDSKIAAPVRQYLQSPAGKSVRCIVLFYGVPLHVQNRPTTDADHGELIQLRRLQDDLNHRIPALADALDRIVQAMGLQPLPATVGTPEDVLRRIESDTRQIASGGANIVDPALVQSVQHQIEQFRQTNITAAQQAMETAGLSTIAPTVNLNIQALVDKPRDAASRSTIRALVTQKDGAISLVKVVQQQLFWIDGEETDAAVDSELPLVLCGDYAFYRWMMNPMNIHQPPNTAPTVMTCRIDAPTAVIARRIIDNSAAVEATGLSGKGVFDSRGLPSTAAGVGYGWFDQILRDTVVYLKAKTHLEIVADDRSQVILPGSVRDAAFYCGWYSVRQYIASCSYRQGAVAYHVASLELVSLHNPREKGWVANLLKDGVDATLGAVSEPYLGSFPHPDEFFPLLLTGKLTLAEVYWATCPMTSWKMILIGDPLYRPYAANPALSAADLPADLRGWFEKVAATQPAGR